MKTLCRSNINDQVTKFCFAIESKSLLDNSLMLNSKITVVLAQNQYFGLQGKLSMAS